MDTWNAGGAVFAMDPLIAAALHATMHAEDSKLVAELPFPVRFRAGGALARWQRVVKYLPGTELMHGGIAG